MAPKAMYSNIWSYFFFQEEIIWIKIFKYSFYTISCVHLSRGARYDTTELIYGWDAIGFLILVLINFIFNA